MNPRNFDSDWDYYDALESIWQNKIPSPFDQLSYRDEQIILEREHGTVTSENSE
ncbi:hypothetical protein HUZ36_04470 [Pseudoalteromonas sp. McH1-7]|uniref:hypothetical protein n=1 Tax=Pseudoalteromonas sp. McH1-7 TaxID=2745574 RepID=UPI00159009B7|nr:hypothetical protein [Pseudoalteromonas sp. McH1-7]NUZ10027.1 hypothetical protein [Pseudoalteromonas sp. McH1-7]